MTTRITGLVSGMDIDTMVSNLMKAEKVPLTKIQQQKTLTSWTTILYREVNTKISQLKASVDDLRLSGDWQQAKAASSDSAVTATAQGNAVTMNHSIDVLQLATGASLEGTAGLSPALTADAAKSSLTIDSSNDQLNVTVNGVKKTISLTQGTYDSASMASELQSKLQAAFGSTITVTTSSDKLNISTTDGLGKITLEDYSGDSALSSLGFTSTKSNRIDPATKTFGSGDLVINGTTISVSATDTLNDIINNVNKSNANVIMAYDQVTDKVSFRTKTTGTTAEIDFTGSTFNLSDLKIPNTIAYGQDARVKIDGAESIFNSNTFVKDGVSYTVSKVVSNVTVGVSQDVDAMVDKIKNFVDVYNQTVELMSTRIKEDKNRSYKPLSDDEKKDMKDADIKLWEDKAKSGLLRGDDIITRGLSGFRLITNESVSTLPAGNNALYSIGITTKSYNANAPQDSAKLQIDESKLREALTKDPDSVIKLFSSQAPADATLTAQDKYNAKGIAQRLYDQCGSVLSEIIAKSGSVGSKDDDITTDLGLKIRNFNNQISDFETKLSKKEEAYYKKFSAMESAIQKSNTQLSYLQQQFS